MPAADVIETLRRFSSPSEDASATARQEAFAGLFEAQFDRVYAFVRFRTGNSAVAEDIAAEAFARAWSKLRDPADRNAATAWLFTTARRLVVDHYRTAPVPAVEAVRESVHPSTPSPESAAVSSERFAVLARCMASLSDREREVIGLRFVARLRNREIGSLVGTSEGNVAKILHRALRKLRDRLAAQGYATSDDPEGVTIR